MFSRKFIVAQIIFFIAFGVMFFAYQRQKVPAIPVYGTVADFKLKDQDDKEVSLKDLKGKVWVTDFIFTTCSGVCPMMTKNMSRLNQEFKDMSDVGLVSISVNPENDTPLALKAYAQKNNAAGKNWLFLTGPRENIQKLATESFKMGDMKEIIFHSSLFVLVDRKGQVRGYYDSGDKERLARLRVDLLALKRELPLLPTINATLNGLAGLFLLMGFIAIKRKDRVLHRYFMMTAFGCSVLFLSCYLYYHFTTHLLTRYQGQGVWKGIYLFVLGTHTPLAVLIIPFIFLAFRHAFKGDYEKHKRITRWLYPAWTYVSVTGVVVYLMLYVFKPA